MAAMSSDGQHAQSAEIRAAILTLLAEEPYNGLEIIKEAAARTDGDWRVTDADLYPLLDQLYEEGLVRLALSGDGGFSRQRPYELTDEGRAHVTQHAATLITPWSDGSAAPAPPAVTPATGGEVQPAASEPQAEAVSVPVSTPEPAEPTAADRFREMSDRFAVAVDQVLEVGSDQQLERARQLVAESRRGLYQILATADDEDEDTTAEET